jgi:hypothetical protein
LLLTIYELSSAVFSSTWFSGFFVSLVSPCFLPITTFLFHRNQTCGLCVCSPLCQARGGTYRVRNTARIKAGTACGESSFERL